MRTEAKSYMPAIFIHDSPPTAASGKICRTDRHSADADKIEREEERDTERE